MGELDASVGVEQPLTGDCSPETRRSEERGSHSQRKIRKGKKRIPHYVLDEKGAGSIRQYLALVFSRRMKTPKEEKADGPPRPSPGLV